MANLLEVLNSSVDFFGKPKMGQKLKIVLRRVQELFIEGG